MLPVYPQLDARFVGSDQPCAGNLLSVAPQVGESEIHDLIAEAARAAEVKGGPLHQLEAHGKLALPIGDDARLGWQLEQTVVDERASR
jgi:hypothetical protein